MKKINKKSKILADFIKFLNGIQEDAPIPRETKFIYFIVDFSNNDINLSYSADERKFEIFDFGWYMPLDAQHFWSSELNKLSHELFDKNSITKKEALELLFDVVLSAKNFCDFLKDYTAFFGERFKKII